MTGQIRFVRLVVIGGTSPAINALATGGNQTVSFVDSVFVNNSVMAGVTGGGARVYKDHPTDWYFRKTGAACTSVTECPNPNSVINIEPDWGEPPATFFSYGFGGVTFDNVSILYPNHYCNRTSAASDRCMPPLSMLPASAALGLQHIQGNVDIYWAGPAREGGGTCAACNISGAPTPCAVKNWYDNPVGVTSRCFPAREWPFNFNKQKE